MGERKRRIERERKAALELLQKWTFPVTEWETSLVEELSGLPRISVSRAPAHQLIAMGMAPQHCHGNALFMEENDPRNIRRRVTGWWISEGKYVLHSVVEENGNYICVTPSSVHANKPFDFIPDPKIEWRKENGTSVPYRDGIALPIGVRAKPEVSLREANELCARLGAGEDPYKIFGFHF